MSIHIRWMIRRDMAEVLDIDGRCFGRAGRLSREEWAALLRHKHTIGMVVESDDRVVGWMVYRIDKQSLELLRLAVHPEETRLGHGRKMVDKLADRLQRTQRKFLAACVPADSLDACRFLSRMGFRMQGSLGQASEFVWVRDAMLRTPET